MRWVIIVITTSERERERGRERDGKEISYIVCRSNAECKSWMSENEWNSKRYDIIFIGHCK
jgi:hypothetical protein